MAEGGGGDGPIARPVVLDPLREVVSFGGTLPLWQQHLLGLIIAGQTPSTEELEVAYKLLLADHGLLDEEPPRGQPLEEVAPPRPGPPSDLRVQSIGPLIDVNRIAAGQVLPFATDGLTVIYGENASGKTGFARVLKAACRSGRGRPILPDVMTQTSAVVPAATVRYRLGSDEHILSWQVDNECPPDLQAIAFFDADEAPILADEERRLEFLPSGLHVLGVLADIVSGFAARLDRAASNIRAGLPPVSVPSGTNAGRVTARLAEGQALPADGELAEAARWSSVDDAALTAKREELRLDPVAAAAREDRLASAVGNMAATVANLALALGDDAIAAIREARTEAHVARAAVAAVAAADAQGHSRLPNVGSDPWLRMLNDASEFMRLAVGSPDLPPADTAMCPLCQQDLDDAAHRRLSRFWSFVQGRAAARANELEAAFADRLSAAASVPIPTLQDAEAMVAAVEPVLPAAAGDLMSAGSLFQLARTRQLWLADPGGVDDIGDGPWPSGLTERLNDHARELAAAAQAHRAAADESARTLLQSDIDELSARQSLAVQLEAARTRLRGLTRLRAIRVARRACDTSNLSRKNTELRSAYLTTEFERQLQREFLALGLDEVRLKLTSRTAAGHSLVSVTLDSPWRLRNRDVLSEGELRALSLACFLADAQRRPGKPPMVLDDPVSSLDHQRVQKVAQRLIGEARRGRQLIVFTHNLVFFHELWMQATESRVPTATHWLTRAAGATGHVQAAEQPWEVQTVKSRIDELARRLAVAKRVDDHASDDYRASVNHFYTGLRETWERLVEEQLLANVVQRFRLGVETRSLRLVEVTDDDYAQVYLAMTRASEFSGHDRAVARQLAAPSPDDLAEDLKALREYHATLKKRAAELDKKRKALHAPPEGQLEWPA